MQIYNRIPPLSIYAPNMTVNQTVRTASLIQDPKQADKDIASGVIIKISPQARALYEASISGNSEADNTFNATSVTAMQKPKECQTCKNRKYVDQSNDPYASFKMPTNISPEAAFAAVSAHERDHISNTQAEAAKNGSEVVSQSVRIHTSICPECGRVYVSGGEARAVIAKYKSNSNQEANVGGLLKMAI